MSLQSDVGVSGNLCGVSGGVDVDIDLVVVDDESVGLCSDTGDRLYGISVINLDGLFRLHVSG